MIARASRSEDPIAALVADDLEAAQDYLRSERLRLFRRHLQLAVTRVSPLVLAALPARVLLPVLERLVPPSSWPSAGLTSPWVWKFGIEAADLACQVPRQGMKGRRSCSALLRHGGVTVRLLGDPQGMLGVKVIGRQLELLAMDDDVLVATQGALVRIRLPMEVPETLRAGAAGLELDAVVRHPLTAGRGYEVRRMVALEGTTLVEAWTGCLPFRMPWPQLGWLP